MLPVGSRLAHRHVRCRQAHRKTGRGLNPHSPDDALISATVAALATPEPIKDWSLTSLKEKLIKIGAKVVRHGRYIIFQMAEVAIARQMFQEILRLIAQLRPQPPPALA